MLENDEVRIELLWPVQGRKVPLLRASRAFIHIFYIVEPKQSHYGRAEKRYPGGSVVSWRRSSRSQGSLRSVLKVTVKRAIRGPQVQEQGTSGITRFLPRTYRSSIGIIMITTSVLASPLRGRRFRRKGSILRPSFVDAKDGKPRTAFQAAAEDIQLRPRELHSQRNRYIPSAARYAIRMAALSLRVALWR